MAKAGYIIHRLGYLDFLSTPEYILVPHLIEHLFTRNVCEKILNNDFLKIQSNSSLLFCFTKLDGISLKEFKFLPDAIYSLDRKSFEIEKSRLFEELTLEQNSLHNLLLEKILEKLIGLPTTQTSLLKYFKYLKFSDVKDIFKKTVNSRNRFLYYIKDKIRKLNISNFQYKLNYQPYCPLKQIRKFT